MEDKEKTLISDLCEFLDHSPTSFHACDNMQKALEREGFVTLSEAEPWRLVPSGRYVVTRNRSSLIAFQMPEAEKASGFQIVASHSDSPMFKIKEHEELTVKDHYVQLDVEPYGGMIMSSWFDRPLTVAGRVVVMTDKGIETRLVRFDDCTAVIPNVAIHMNREVNKGYEYRANVDLLPLFGDIRTRGEFRSLLAERAGVSPDRILGHDLYLCNAMKSQVWGQRQEYISSARLDNLECAFCSCAAILQAGHTQAVQMVAVFDNEEVGSTTKQGADSTFLSDVMRRIATALGEGEEGYQRMLASSMMLSADNAHATHPNHPEYSDPVNLAYMNEGIVIKFNARQKYTSDAVSEGLLHWILQKAGVKVQHYANRSDMPGGGTLGNISGSHVSIQTVDIGLAQLAMHSAWETAGTGDVEEMVRGMTAFFNTGIRAGKDGNFELTPAEAGTDAP